MGNPTIGFRMVEIILDFHKLDHSLRCGPAETALDAISAMMASLRSLRRAIRADINAVAWIKGAKGR